MQTGYIRVERANLELVKNAFMSEGFTETVLQDRKMGQHWGGVKLIDQNNEMHVRIIETYDNFGPLLIVDSEIEVPRDFLEHLSENFKAQPYHGPALDILRRYGIPHNVVGFLPQDPFLVNRPTQPTPWKPMLAVAIILGAIGFFGSFFD
jgi:hypothetical protein